MSPTSCQLLYSASWWGEVDSNHRRRCQQIYSLLPLATRESPHKAGTGLISGGADDGTRTRNLLITNQLLYQLSYIGTACDDYYIISPGPMSRSFPPHFPPLFGRLSSGAGTLAIWRAGPYNIS